MDGITQVGQADAVHQATSIFALKKTLQMEQQAMLTLLDAVPQPAPANNPPNLGQNIDVRA